MKRKEILEQAMECVTKNRATDYGPAEDSFQCVANLLNAIKLKSPFSAVDVALILMLLKIAKVRYGPGKPDSWIDIARYAACGGELATAKDTKTYDVMLDEMLKDEELRKKKTVAEILKQMDEQEEIPVRKGLKDEQSSNVPKVVGNPGPRGVGDYIKG